MAEIDIRKNSETRIDSIRIEDDSNDNDYTQAHLVKKDDKFYGTVIVQDTVDDYVRISSVEHAKYLIAAMERAISLGWFSK